MLASIGERIGLSAVTANVCCSPSPRLTGSARSRLPPLEDKIVAAGDLLHIAQCDLRRKSYSGSRMDPEPGAARTTALDALVVGIESTKVNWILDADVRCVLRRNQPAMAEFVSWNIRIGDRPASSS